MSNYHFKWLYTYKNLLVCIIGSSRANSGKRKGKQGSGKRPKLVTYTLKVVPVGADAQAYHSKHLKQVNVERSMTELDTLSVLKEHLHVPPHKTLTFMYTHGRSLRPASPADVQATSWDARAIHTLMGSGHLYVAVTDGIVIKDIKKEPDVVQVSILHIKCTDIKC